MRSTVILVLILLLGAALASCAGTMAAPSAPRATPGPDTTPSPTEIDRAFIQAMVVHHAAAIAMAKVEVQRGQQAEVKQLAQQIIGEQEGEITRLQQIAQQDFRFRPSTTLPATTQQGVLMGEPILMNFPEEIRELNSASDPDVRFLQMMIPHHAMAIVQADTETSYGSNPRLKAISQNIIRSQSREIGTMEDLLQRRTH